MDGVFLYSYNCNPICFKRNNEFKPVFKNVEEVLINSTYIVTFYTSERQTPKNS